MGNKNNKEFAVLLGHSTHPAIKYPVDHKVGIAVPEGGSNCAKCEYVDGKNCTKELFVIWNGGKKIPGDINRYCCDFFEAKE